jgi:hypothetical protein
VDFVVISQQYGVVCERKETPQMQSRLKGSAPMSRIIKWLVFTFLWSALFASGAHAKTITAVDCQQASVTAAWNAAVDGDVVNIPAGTCTWTTTLSLNVSGRALTLQGQTTCSGTPTSACVDNTIIIDGVARGSDIPMLQITTTSTKAFRITGLTFRWAGGITFNGSVKILGSTTQLRYDHIHVFHVNAVATWIDGPVGVVDHVLYDMSVGSTNNGIHVAHGSWLGVGDFGDNSFANASNFGSSAFLFIEDSTFNNGFANDCNRGGRFVFRHNVIFNSGSSIGGVLQTHEMAGRQRGCRAYEVYSDSFTAPAGTDTDWFNRMGTGVYWGNTLSGYNFAQKLINDRSSNLLGQTPTPNGWGFCGTTFGPSTWDQNTGSTGYACLDQIGRGKGDLLANDFPNAVNTTTGTIAWPNEVLEPYYDWLNVFGGATPVNPSGPIQANRDYYTANVSFNGTSGTGSGLLSARPATCTVMVGYWATDTNTFYRCTTTNTWTVYYTPYTYPHPLTLGSGTRPTPPTGLADVVN